MWTVRAVVGEPTILLRIPLPMIRLKARKTSITLHGLSADSTAAVDYPAETLHETIPNFHNTVDRFAKFREL